MFFLLTLCLIVSAYAQDTALIEAEVAYTKEDYAKVKAADGHVYYMACALLDTVLGRLAEEGKDAYEILETYKGTDLEGKEYEPLYLSEADEEAKQR